MSEGSERVREGKAGGSTRASSDCPFRNNQEKARKILNAFISKRGEKITSAKTNSLRQKGKSKKDAE